MRRRIRPNVAAHADRFRFKTRLRWQYSVRPRLGGVTWLANRMPWTVWCVLCASGAEAVVHELGRRSSGPLRFVQVGSNEGVANDPLHETARARRWTGVLVEPLPHLFARLVENYQGVDGVSFVNAAIGPEDGTVTMYTVEAQEDDPEWVHQIASLDRDVVLRHAYALRDLESRIRPVEVECLSLGTLVARQGLVGVDLMHTDAEGYDKDIIEQIRFDAEWAPRFLLFEVKHMDREAYFATKARLEAAGYRLAGLWPDEFAYRTPPT